MAETRQLCMFYIGDNCFGVDVIDVREVLRDQGLTRVPLAPPVIGGLINLRGEIVTAVDLRRLLDLDEREQGVRAENVVITQDDEVISLLVDQIGDVLDVSEAHFEAPPETVQGIARELVTGVYKLEDRLALVLDTRKVIAMAEVSEKNAGRYH